LSLYFSLALCLIICIVIIVVMAAPMCLLVISSPRRLPSGTPFRRLQPSRMGSGVRDNISFQIFSRGDSNIGGNISGVMSLIRCRHIDMSIAVVAKWVGVGRLETETFNKAFFSTLHVIRSTVETLLSKCPSPSLSPPP